VNVTEHGQQTKVRVNVRMTVTDELTDKVLSAGDIDDPAYYQHLFAKVDKGVFIQSEKL